MPRIKSLAIIVSCLCACTNASSQSTKSVDSAKIPALADSVVTAANAIPPAPVEALRPASDTAIPRTFVDTAAWIDAKQVIDTSETAPAFQCAPRIFTAADTLTLRITAPHGDWLSVKRPDETVFYLVTPGSETAPNYSIVPSETFKDKVMIRFEGAIITRPGPDGNGTMTAIFNEPGRYEFRVGKDLATNRPRDVHECMIRLVPLSRY